MATQRLDLKHVRILMASHAKYAIRGGSGLTYALIVVVLGLIIAGLLIDPLDAQRQRLEREHGGTLPREVFVGGVVQGLRHLSDVWLGLPSSDPRVDYLLDRRPALLSIMFVILLAFEPFVMAFGAFNQLSGDISNRGLRYLLLRTSRLNVVVARFIGTFLFSALTSLFTVIVIVAYLALRYDLYPLSELATWGLYGWGALNLFSLPYLTLCTWISTGLTSPFGALALSQVAIGIPIVLINYVQMLWRDRFELDWISRLTPWGWRLELFHPDPGRLAIGAAALLGFSLLFLFLGTRQFLRRDL